MADECPICLEVMHTKSDRVRLACGHWYHVECLTAFFHHKDLPICPYCRQEVIPCRAEIKLAVESCLVKMVSVGMILTYDSQRRCQDFLLFVRKRSQRSGSLGSAADERSTMAVQLLCLCTVDEELVRLLLDERLDSLLKRGYLKEDTTGYVYQA